jgi:PEGA domain
MTMKQGRGLVCAWLAVAGLGGWDPPAADAAANDPFASIRMQVEPPQTEVFVDGYYAGTIDDFDGFFQRLRTEPGEHELELYLEGHRSVRQKIFLQPGATFRVRHTMVALQAGEAPDPRPVPLVPPPPGPYDAFGRPPSGVPTPPPLPPRSATAPSSPTPASEFGTLAVRVQPDGAEVLVDGERWEVPSAAERLVIQLPIGEHRVDVRRSGFAPYTSTIVIRAGETSTLNVSLTRE